MTINVMATVAINVTINVTTQAITTTAPSDCEVESEFVFESVPKIYS